MLYYNYNNNLFILFFIFTSENTLKIARIKDSINDLTGSEFKCE